MNMKWHRSGQIALERGTAMHKEIERRLNMSHTPGPWNNHSMTPLETQLYKALLKLWRVSEEPHRIRHIVTDAVNAYEFKEGLIKSLKPKWEDK